MAYVESYEKTYEYMRLTIQYLIRYCLPADPWNYTVWYEYLRGVNPHLQKALDDYLQQDKKITPEIVHDLFRDFILDQSVIKGEKALEEIKTILLDISKKIKEAGGDIAAKGGHIETYARKLSGDVSLDDIREIVKGIVVETKAILNSGEVLKEKLLTTDREMDRLREELLIVREKATIDALTGLVNRSVFQETLGKMAEKAVKDNRNLCLVLADIDHFKKINDTHGHLVGDTVLKKSAEMIKNLIKGRDLAARYGGEEFVLLLPDTSLEGGRRVAEEIRSHFETKRWKQRDSGEPIGVITLSLGVAEFRPGEPLETLIKRADEALYCSKKEGRNRVTTEKEIR
ncbi:MAG: GGDEF domain-containing protein [Thermodesulfobacteriota bacterium]